VPSREILVIGAGIVGCAVAYELARRGASVDVIDDRAPGMGATQASAGMLTPYLEAASGAHLDLAVRGLAAWDDFVPRVTADSGIRATYRRTGSLSVALDERTADSLAATAKALAASGVDAELVDTGAVQLREPALSVEARRGLFIATHGWVDAHDVTRALAGAARRHGSRFVEQGRVTRVARSGDEFTALTERGPLTADLVIVAAGSWSGGIEVAGDEPLPVHPVRGQLVRLAWPGAPLERIVWGEDCYLVPWPDGTVLVGATVEEVGFDERTTVAGVRGLLDAASTLVPHMASATFLGARAGLRPATPDDLPIIGPSAQVKDLWYATGHYRSGVLLAPLTASLMADAILEGRRDPLLLAMSPDRFALGPTT
jgi:glycine oxidase